MGMFPEIINVTALVGLVVITLRYSHLCSDVTGRIFGAGFSSQRVNVSQGRVLLSVSEGITGQVSPVRE